MKGKLSMKRRACQACAVVPFVGLFLLRAIDVLYFDVTLTAQVRARVEGHLTMITTNLHAIMDTLLQLQIPSYMLMLFANMMGALLIFWSSSQPLQATMVAAVLFAVEKQVSDWFIPSRCFEQYASPCRE